MEIRAVPIRDRRTPTDRWGNPKYILKIVEPPELRGLIAFPDEEEVILPSVEYQVEIVRRCTNCVRVRIVRSEKYDSPIIKRWKHVREPWYKLNAMVLPSPPKIEKLYIVLLDREAYEDYFASKAKGNPCELHCSQSLRSVLDDVWPNSRTTNCYRGDWLERWRCVFSARADAIDFVWYVDGTVYSSEKEALEAYQNQLNHYKEEMRKYENKIDQLNAMIEDAKSDRIMIADDMGIHVKRVYDLLL